MSKFSKNFQKVTQVRHWTENLFSFRITRPKSFKFRSGEFVMIGLLDSDDKPILRAYSICSPSWSEELEFYSIIVKDGPLTSKLKKIKIGDEIIMMPKSTGTLVLDALKPGKRLFLLSSGTGFAPFASLISAANGANPVPEESKNNLFPGFNASKTNVPVDLGIIIISSPIFIFFNFDVKGPSFTIIE